MILLLVMQDLDSEETVIMPVQVMVVPVEAAGMVVLVLIQTDLVMMIEVVEAVLVTFIQQKLL